LNYRELRQEGARRLKEHGVPDPDFDARELLFFASGMDYQTYILKESEDADEIREAYLALIDRRAAREPLQHLTGFQEFMGYEFKVSKDVLIPRQDTETLVMEAEKDLRSRTGERSEEVFIERSGEGFGESSEEGFKGRSEKSSGEIRLLDVCTGSGCIILPLVLRNIDRIPGLSAEASDLSEQALAVAEENAERLGVRDRVVFHQGDLFQFNDPGSSSYDLIVSNPPYIPSDVIPGLMPEVRSGDPILALDGGKDGLSIYRRLIPGAYERLKNGGALYLEIGFDQAKAVTDLMEKAGFTEVRTIQDLAGNDRVICGKKVSN
jgi:release factor glutamine methyltransferase